MLYAIRLQAYNIHSLYAFVDEGNFYWFIPYCISKKLCTFALPEKILYIDVDVASFKLTELATRNSISFEYDKKTLNCVFTYAFQRFFLAGT
jgi:hypothetical protein